jgi:hypothetical protein
VRLNTGGRSYLIAELIFVGVAPTLSASTQCRFKQPTAGANYPTLSGILSAISNTFTDTPEPMLARIADPLSIGPAWSYEVKSGAHLIAPT